MDTTTTTTTALSCPALDATGLRPDSSAHPDGSHELLCLRTAGQEYGLPLRGIQEIRSYQAATPLPGQAAAVLGVMDLRGQVIALLDLRRLLGLPDAEDLAAEAQLRAVVVLVHRGRRLGLVVDEVLDVLAVEPAQFRAMPPLPGDAGWLRGLVAAGPRRVLLLNPEAWIEAHASRPA